MVFVCTLEYFEKDRGAVSFKLRILIWVLSIIWILTYIIIHNLKILCENQTFLLLTFDVVSLYLFYVFFFLAFFLSCKESKPFWIHIWFYGVLYFFPNTYTEGTIEVTYIHIYFKNILEHVKMRIHKAFEPIICIVVAEQHVHWLEVAIKEVLVFEASFLYI